jgi:hypothetical protein
MRTLDEERDEVSACGARFECFVVFLGLYLDWHPLPVI